MQLIHGDSLKLLKDIPAESIDMVLTDPPYGMSYQSNHRKTKHAKIALDDSLDWLDVFFAEAYRVAKPNTAHYIFCSWHHIDKFKQSAELDFVVKNILVWDKNNHGSGDLDGDYAPKHELILFLQKGRKLRTAGERRLPNVLTCPKTSNDLHPTQKPVDLLETLITQFSNPGDIVLDAFAGSGSTAIACINTQRDFIGMEISEEYYNIARARIDAHVIARDSTFKSLFG